MAASPLAPFDELWGEVFPSFITSIQKRPVPLQMEVSLEGPSEMSMMPDA